MEYRAQCIKCLIDRQIKRTESLPGGEAKRVAFFRDAMQEMIDAPTGLASPYMLSRINVAFKKHYGEDSSYDEIKRMSNQFIMDRLDGIRAAIESSEDKLLTALKFALAGNYIDFGALKGNVSYEKMDQLLKTAPDEKVDENNYAALRADLEKAKNLLYVTDNAGEIALDAEFQRVIKEMYPDISIKTVVRGAPVINDATIDDARAVGIDKYSEILEPANAVSGFYIEGCGEKVRAALDSADVIIAKGQGNVEMMSGCGLNVYYMFLCKCDLFTEIFGVPKLTGVLMKEYGRAL